MPMKDKWERSGSHQGEPADYEADLTSVKGAGEGSKFGYKEP